MYKCKYCDKEFDTKQKLGGHVSRCTKNPNIIQSVSKKQIYKIICQKCGKEFELELTISQYNNKKYKKYCSRSCANSRIFSIEAKNKKSNLLYKHRVCNVCGKTYTLNKSLFPESTKFVCCKKCYKYYLTHKKDFLSESTIDKLHKSGLKSTYVQKENRRSKNEKYFCNLCENYFTKVLHNVPIFNGWDADVIIEDIKFAVLWNGKWHYEKICKPHSVNQVQNRDKFKIDNIKKCNYIPYIIKDMGKYNKTFVEKQFDIFIDYLKQNNYIAD